MARQEGTFKIPANIEPRAAAPLDARQIVATLADLTTAGTFSYPYEGMPVYVKSEHKYYIYKGGGVTTSSNWEVFGSGGGGFETLFKASTSLFSKEIDGITQLSSLSSIKHAYDSTSSISESDLINNISLVLDVDNTLVVYLGKNNQNKYLFKTIQIGITCEYDESEVEFCISAPIGAIWTKSDIVPYNSGTDLGYYSRRFNALYTQYVDALWHVSAPLFTSTVDESVSEPQIRLRTEYNDGTSHELKFRSLSDIFASRSFYDENGDLDHEYLYKLPTAGGTLALTSNIPSNLDSLPDGSTRKLANYLPLAGGTLTGGLNIASGIGISDPSGNGLLVYKPSSWTGISSSQWGVGAVNCQGVIRSDANSLIHYRGSAAYTIYDSYNYPSCDTAATANTVAKRDSRGYLKCVYLNTSNSTEDINNYSGAVATFQSTDGWLRKTSVANFFKNFGWVSSKFIMAFVKLTVSTNGAITELQYQKIYGSFTLTASTTGSVSNTISNTTNGIVITCSVAARFTGFCSDSSYVRIGNANSGGVTGGGAPFYNGSTKYICIAFKHSSYNSGYGIFIIIGSTETF